MTSTNDGKEVKINQTSGQKVKSYYIEIYKSLDARLCGECTGAERTRLVCEAWCRVHGLCLHSVASTHTHLLSWLQKHTSHTILQSEWQSPNSQDQHKWLEEAITAFIAECQDAIAQRGKVILSWEGQLLQRARWFLTVLPSPWGHQVLKALLDTRGPQPSDKEVLEWLKEERGAMFVTRLRQLVASKCDDLALLLTTAVMDRSRFTIRIVPDVVQAEESEDAPEDQEIESVCHKALRKEAGFTPDIWELLTDIEFVLLFKSQAQARCIELAKQTPLRNGCRQVKRLRNRLENFPQEKKLWKNAKDVATLIAQVVVARCMVVPVCVGMGRAALYNCTCLLVQLLPKEKMPNAAAALAAPAATALHLYTLASAVHSQCKDHRPFVCTLYVRAITAGMNELENLKFNTEKESEARATEITLASWFMQLGTLLSASSRLSCECTLTAFSVHPSEDMYKKVKEAPLLPLLHKSDTEQQEPVTSSEFGSWATDSRTQTNLVKTSETLNLKQTQKQANVLSTAIFSEGEALGLEADLCQDLAVLLSGPRVKTLYLDLDRDLLLENCRIYMDRTHGGTRALTTELKYLNLDPKSFQHLPEEEEDENNVFYGIEKGYEHLVEFEEPEEIREKSLLSDYSVNSDTGSLLEVPIAIPKRKKKSKLAQISSEEEVDPLSCFDDTLKLDKTEEHHSKEKSKHKNKERSKSKVNMHIINGHDENNSLIDEKSKQVKKKQKKKEKKERKRIEKLEIRRMNIKQENFQPCTNLSKLVGIKIAQPANSNTSNIRSNTHLNTNNNMCITDSDYDSQGKSSMTSMNSESNDNVIFDGLYSMEDLKSAEKMLTDQKPATSTQQFKFTQQNVNSVKEDVKRGIQKLIEYRRNKVLNVKSKIHETPVTHVPGITMDRSALIHENLSNNVYSPFINNIIIPELPNTSTYKTQIKHLTPANELTDFCVGNNKDNNPIVEKKILNPPFNKSKEYKGMLINDSLIRKNPPVMIEVNNTPKNSTLVKKHTNKFIETSSQKEYKDFLKQRKFDSIQDELRKTAETPSQIQFHEFLKNQSTVPTDKVAASSLYQTHKIQDFRRQPSQQTNTGGKQFHSFLKELQETINAGATNDKPVSSTFDKTLSSKKNIQPKKVNNAPNTFARLSYMHKNKQGDNKPKLTNQTTQNKPLSVSTEQIHHFKDISLEKMSQLQSKGEIVISRIDKSKNSTDENSKILVQNIENFNGSSSTSINSSFNYNKQYPVISSMLSSDKPKADYPALKNDVKVVKQCNTPTSKVNTSFLSEKDQFDLLLLLRQQSKMNPPKIQTKTELPKKTPSDITVINNCVTHRTTSDKPTGGKNSTLIPNAPKSRSCPTSVIKVTQNKSQGNVSELKKNRIGKGSREGSSSKVKMKANDIQSDWKSVMDDLLAQKTPSRGPNALDIVLKKDSFDKRTTDNSSTTTVPNYRSAITSFITPNKTGANVDTLIQSAVDLNPKPSTSSISSFTLKSTKLSSDLKQKQDPAQSFAKSGGHDMLKRSPIEHTQEKNFTSVIQNNNDPFISGIPNSDYDLLEELMDDDLRQEIGELSSDDEAYRIANLSTSKTKNSLHNKKSGLAGSLLDVNLKSNLNSVTCGYNTNYSIVNKDPSLNNSLPKNVIHKKSLFVNDINSQLRVSNELGTGQILNKSISSNKMFKNGYDVKLGANEHNSRNLHRESTYDVKKNPLVTTLNRKILHSNKIPAVSMRTTSAKIEDAAKYLSGNVNVHNVQKCSNALDPVQGPSQVQVFTVPQRKTNPNVMLIDTDLIYKPISTVQTIQSNKSGDLSDLNESTYVAINQAPINLTLLQSSPFVRPVLNPVIIESAIALPIIQNVSPNESINLTASTVKPVLNTIATNYQRLDDITSQFLKPTASNEGLLFHKDKKSAGTSNMANCDASRHTTVTSSHSFSTTRSELKKSCSLNNVFEDVSDSLQYKKTLCIKHSNTKCVENPDSNKRSKKQNLPHAEDSQSFSVTQRTILNEYENETPPVNNKNKNLIDQQRIQTKRFLILNRNIHNWSHEKPIALPYASINMSKQLNKQSEIQFTKSSQSVLKNTCTNNGIKNTSDRITLHHNNFELDSKLDYNKKSIELAKINSDKNNSDSGWSGLCISSLNKPKTPSQPTVKSKSGCSEQSIELTNILIGPNQDTKVCNTNEHHIEADTDVDKKRNDRDEQLICPIISGESLKENAIDVRKKLNNEKVQPFLVQLGPHQNRDPFKIASQKQIKACEVVKKPKLSIPKMSTENALENCLIKPKRLDIKEQLKPIIINSSNEKPNKWSIKDKVGVEINNVPIVEKDCELNNKIEQKSNTVQKVLKKVRGVGPIVPDWESVCSNITVKSFDKVSPELMENKTLEDVCNKKSSINLTNQPSGLKKPSSLDNKIVFDELPNAGNGPLKRCVRIKLPNGNTFKATISGKLNVEIDSIFEDPAVKSLLWKNITNNTKCTLNIKQVSIQNKKQLPILKTEVKDICYPQKTITESETIDLISDDEEASLKSFKTEFGNFKIGNMDPQIFTKHQKKLSHKSVVKLEKCDSMQKSVPVVQGNIKSIESTKVVHKENLLYTPQKHVLDYIEIDDSSNDSIHTKNTLAKHTKESNKIGISSEKVDSLKNVLLKNLGVEDTVTDVQAAEVNVQNMEELNSNVEEIVPPSNQNNKPKKVILKLQKCDDLIEKLRIRKQKCFVNLIRCDGVVKCFEKQSYLYNGSKTDKDMQHSKGENMVVERVLQKSCSVPILNEIVLDSTVESSSYNGETLEPVSPSLIDNFQFELSLPENLTKTTNLLELPNIICEAEWLMTKPSINRNFHNIYISTKVSTKHEKYELSLIDCVSDFDTHTSDKKSTKENIFVKKYFGVPSLVRLIMNVLANDSQILDRYINTDIILKHVTDSSPLKRKFTETTDPGLRQNKIVKVENCCAYVNNAKDHTSQRVLSNILLKTNRNILFEKDVIASSNNLDNIACYSLLKNKESLSDKNISTCNEHSNSLLELKKKDLEVDCDQLLSLPNEFDIEKLTADNSSPMCPHEEIHLFHEPEALCLDKDNREIINNVNDKNSSECCDVITEVIDISQTKCDQRKDSPINTLQNCIRINCGMEGNNMPTVSEISSSELFKPVVALRSSNIQTDSHFDKVSADLIAEGPLNFLKINSKIQDNNVGSSTNDISERDCYSMNKIKDVEELKMHDNNVDIKINAEPYMIHLKPNALKEVYYSKDRSNKFYNTEHCTIFTEYRELPEAHSNMQTNLYNQSVSHAVESPSTIQVSKTETKATVTPKQTEDNTSTNNINAFDLLITRPKETSEHDLTENVRDLKRQDTQEKDYLETFTTSKQTESKNVLKGHQGMSICSKNVDDVGDFKEHKFFPIDNLDLKTSMTMNEATLVPLTTTCDVTDELKMQVPKGEKPIGNYINKNDDLTKSTMKTEVLPKLLKEQNNIVSDDTFIPSYVGILNSLPESKISVNTNNEQIQPIYDLQLGLHIKQESFHHVKTSPSKLSDSIKINNTVAKKQNNLALHFSSKMSLVNEESNAVGNVKNIISLKNKEMSYKNNIKPIIVKRLVSISQPNLKHVYSTITQQAHFNSQSNKTLPQDTIVIETSPQSILRRHYLIDNTKMKKENVDGIKSNNKPVKLTTETVKVKYKANYSLNESNHLLPNNCDVESNKHIAEDNVKFQKKEFKETDIQAEFHESGVLSKDKIKKSHNLIDLIKTENLNGTENNFENVSILSRPLQQSELELNTQKVEDNSFPFCHVVDQVTETGAKMLDTNENNKENNSYIKLARSVLETKPNDSGININRNDIDSTVPFKDTKNEVIETEISSKRDFDAYTDKNKFVNNPPALENRILTKDTNFEYFVNTNLINKRSDPGNGIRQFRDTELVKKEYNMTSDSKLQKNVTLVYKGDSSVVLKGSIYENPIVGTCYVFPVKNRASLNQENNYNNIGDNKSIGMLERFKSMPFDDYNKSNVLEDCQKNENFNVVMPKVTYSRRKLKNSDEFVVDDKSCKKNLKRQLVYFDNKQAKRYRKGKNIDYPKFSVATMLDSAYGREYKRLLDYCSSIKFSYSRPFHKEYIDVSGILKCWPIKERDINASDNTGFESILFSEEQFEDKVPFDPLQQTLAEEISNQCNKKNQYNSDPINESNFNMGFGERSDRVIKISEDCDNISKVSAATLSDVKQSQPFLTSKNYRDCEKNHKLRMSNKQQLEILRRSISYIQLKEKVRSFFKKTTAELNSNWLMDNTKNKYNKSLSNIYVNSGFPYDLLNTDYFEPAPVEAIVQVVQVGQLPVSAAAQNPVTCDPRVTQVTDASPQCSMENSPHDDSQSPMKTEYTELTTADLSLPLVHEYDRQIEAQECSKVPNSHHEDIPVETEITSVVKTEITVELSPLKEEPIDYSENEDLQSLVSKHINNVEYSFDSNDNSILDSQSTPDITYESLENREPDFTSQQKPQNSSTEKTDQIAHAMNAAGITTTSEAINNTRPHALVNMLSHKIGQEGPPVTSPSANNYAKTPINAMTLQQALAQILPPPLNQTNVNEHNQTSANSSVSSQVLHIVQGKNTNGNQITLVDNTQNSVISNSNTPVLHIVQNKGASTATSNVNSGQHTNSYSGLSLVDTGIQQGNNQLLHIVNTGNQKNNNTAQLLKRVNLLTNLTNVQGANEQKMVQFVCKSADGKSIHLNAPHQRSMVLRLQPIESPNVQTSTKGTENQDSISAASNSNNATPIKESTNGQNEIKSRSVYEENYAKFIQSSSNKSVEKSTSLPKFNQAFGKQVYQDSNQKGNEINSNNSNLSSINSNTESSECQSNDNSVNLEHIGQINSPPLLLRKSPSQPTQTQSPQPNLVQHIKQTIAPMNIQTMHGGVIYTRQIPVNIGGGQTINLITVPSTELIDESTQKQKSDVKFVNQNELDPPIIKIVPQNQSTSNSGVSDESSTQPGLPSESTQNTQTHHQPVLTQMRIKLPMLSKTPQMVSGARVVRPSFFQIQRNVIGGANQHVYQQLVLTAAPPLGQHTIRLPQAQTGRLITKTTAEGQSTSQPQMSSSTLEQLREFDMVLEQVKERSTVQPNSNSNKTFTKLLTPATDTSDSASVTSTVTESTQQVLYSIGSNQSLNVAYINRKTIATTPTTSTFIRSPDSSGIIDSPSSSTHVQIPRTVTRESANNEAQPNQPKPAKVGSKSKSRPKASSHLPNSLKINNVPPKTSTQKPLEDEQTTQRILYILAEYKEQVENSPDKDKPAPRRRSNPPTNPIGSSKRKKSSSGSRRPGVRDMSPVHGEDTCRTMGSEDSSCGTSQGDCNENCLDSHSPQDSPRKVVRKLTFENETATVTQPRPQPQRNVIVADGQTITVARGTAGKPTTAVLMPANYILPVSMVKGGQQIAIVTNRGPKLLTVGGGEGGTTNALLLQRLIGPAGLKPVLTRPGVRHVRLPTAALHNLQAFNLTTATTVQPPDSTASPAPAPTPDLVEPRANSSPWTDRESQDVKPERDSSPEGSEPWNLPSSADPHDYTYEETVRSENMDRTVLEAIPDRYSPDMEAQRIFDKMFDVDSKKSYIVDTHDDSSRCAYDIDASDCDDKVYHQVVHKKDNSSQRHHRLTHVSAAALRHKYAILEHELRLQKSLSEECEDLGVDSPSASELFPEAELLFAASPAHDAPQHSHTPQPTILSQSGIPQPDIDDQIATDELLQRNVHDDQQELDVTTLGLDEGIVTVSEDGMQATIAVDQEEFARSHPNTTFHSEPTDEGEIQPFTIAGLKGRHITSTIFHASRAPATVLVTAPQTTVISQANPDIAMHNNVKYANIDQIINSSQGHHGNLNLSSVLVKDDGLTKFDSILTDSRELHLSNTASAIVHSTGNATQVIRRVCYEDEKRDTRFLIDEPDGLIAGDDAKMVAEDSSRDATLESIAGDVDDDNSSPEHTRDLFWESNSASERSESRRPLDFSSDSEKCCKSPSFDETNSTDSSGVGTHMRLDSVIKDARGMERSGSADGSSADDTHPPLRTYPAKRMYHGMEGEMERSMSGKTRAGESSPGNLEVRRRASGRGVVKRGCHCCTGSPAPPRPKKSRQKKPTMEFAN